MKVLLDTHIWLWYLLGDPRLAKKQRKVIQNEENELWLSPVSLWEAHLLIERGRLPVVDDASVWLKKALQALAVREAGLSFAIVLRSRKLSLTRQDPADRFIVATALEKRLCLLTADEGLRACPELDCVA